MRQWGHARRVKELVKSSASIYRVCLMKKKQSETVVLIVGMWRLQTITRGSSLLPANIIIFPLTQNCRYAITRKNREIFYCTGFFFQILLKRTRISKRLKK